MVKKYLSIVTLCFVLAGNIFAGGFQINEQGARAMALAGAFTGLANDASAVYFNPAGITQLDGTNILAGLTLIAPSSSFTGPTPLTITTDMEKQLFPPINFYITHQFSDEVYGGLSVNVPYGLGTKWGETWVGSQLAVDTELRTFFFNGVLAYKFSDQFSLSGGVTFAYADVKIIRNQAVTPQRVESNIKGDATAWGFSAGALYKPADNFQIGLSYRSEIKFDFEGDLVVTNVTTATELANVTATAPLSTPQNITLGLAFFATDMLTLTADFQYVGWSSYDKLEVTSVLGTTSADRKYENTYIIRGGAEYVMSDVFTLRGGLYYDNNPVLDEYVEPTLPDSDRLGFNIGFGYKLSEKIGVDFAYMFLYFMDREIDNSVYGFNGTYKSSTHLFGLNFSYSL